MVFLTFPMVREAVGDIYHLWDPHVSFPPSLEEIPPLPFAEYGVVHLGREHEHKYTHAPAVAFDGEDLVVGWQSAPWDEGDADQIILARRSLDGGKTWMPLEFITPKLEGRDRYGFCVFLNHHNGFWAMSTKRRSSQMVAFRYDPVKGNWNEHCVVFTKNEWTATDAIRLMDNGRYILSGGVLENRIGISDVGSLANWTFSRINHDPDLRFPLASLIVQGREITAIMRNSQTPLALVAKSFDYGVSWSQPRVSNFPMSAARPFAGKLSNGSIFVISNTPPNKNSHSRQALTIAVGDPGKFRLNKIWRISRGTPLPLLYPGHAKGRQYSYPSAVEFKEKLYVVYSVNKEDCELAIIPLEVLN